MKAFKFTLVLLFGVLLWPQAAVSQQEKPNLIIIHTDEHNFRTLGCYRDILSEDQAFVWEKGLKLKHLISIE